MGDWHALRPAFSGSTEGRGVAVVIAIFEPQSSNDPPIRNFHDGELPCIAAAIQRRFERAKAAKFC
jgi:hypothetical protein